MPRTKEQNEAIRAEKRLIILDAALELFAEDGYAHTSIEKIARHAKVAKGLIYTYFKSKEDLLHQILLSGFGKVSYDMFRRNMTPEEYVQSIEQVFDSMTEYKDFFKLYTALSVQPSVSKKLAALTDSKSRDGAIVKFYKRQFGKDAKKQMLLITTLIKGYSVVYLYGEGQSAIPLPTLRKTVVNYIKDQFNYNKNEKHTGNHLLRNGNNGKRLGSGSKRYGNSKKSR